MYYNTSMFARFESEKNKKALAYTTVILVVMLLMAVLISWKLPEPPEPVVQDLIEINLGNEVEGAGVVQPLIKGEKAPDRQIPEPQQQKTIAVAEPIKNIEPDVNEDDKDAAPIEKPIKVTPVPKPVAVAVVPVPKPQKPKISGYNGPRTGTGNGATEDNGYKYQGNNPNGKGDSGNPNGRADSYGNSPGGKPGGGLRVSKGDRSIINNYIFMGDLPKATINAVIKVSPDGRGQFVTFDKGSTSNESSYVNAIRSYLPNIKFSKADHESIVTVPFNFRVN